MDKPKTPNITVAVTDICGTEFKKECRENPECCKECKHHHEFHRIRKSGGWCPPCDMCGLEPEHPYWMVGYHCRVVTEAGEQVGEMRMLCPDCALKAAQAFKDAK